MAWTAREWSGFVAVLQRGFAARDPFTDADANVYRLMLDDVDPAAASRVLKEIGLEGQALRPKPGDILGRLRRDPGRPSFDEACELIFGPGGVLAAQPPPGPVHRAIATGGYPDQTAEAKARRDAALDRAKGFHPLIAQFVIRQGLDRLRQLPIHDRDYGELRRAELKKSWEAHVEAFDNRDVAARALPAGERRGALERFNPLAALNARPDLLALPRGDE
jgi:hypothetical protein